MCHLSKAKIGGRRKSSTPIQNHFKQHPPANPNSFCWGQTKNLGIAIFSLDFFTNGDKDELHLNYLIVHYGKTRS
ncbi:hypothetical protein L1887_16703 [Cichorium endivia]|nr:hypothetical protein L1887_16703 [Cichorium endivia]